jgi:hypothetical protein
MRRLLLMSLLLPLACQKSVLDEDTTNADESTEEEMTTADESTDADTANADESTDTTGDGDGDGECIAEDQIPGTCYCVEPGTQPCFQGCQPNTAMLTCTEVCAQIGETCVANGCASDETAAHGHEDLCPSNLSLKGFTNQACDELIPALGVKVSCCCTLS